MLFFSTLRYKGDVNMIFFALIVSFFPLFFSFHRNTKKSGADEAKTGNSSNGGGGGEQGEAIYLLIFDFLVS